MKFLSTLLLAAALLVSSAAQAADPIVEQLQNISVTIKSQGGQGSGVLFTRGDRTYVWTAAHVVDNLRKTRQVIVNGTSKTVVEFSDAQIVKEFRQDGRRIGEICMDARVVRFSDAEQGHDLALLEVRQRGFSKDTVTFADSSIPELGTELYHVGSLRGQFGANSLTTGVISQVGRVLDLGANGVVFDQTSATAQPGSSGGGVFRKKDGQYVGMLVRGAGEQFNFIVPTRRLRDWAEEAKVMWAVDQSVAMPSDKELAKLPIEDAGVTFDPRMESTAKQVNKQFPFLLNYPLQLNAAE